MLADCPCTSTNPAIIVNAASVRKHSQKTAKAFIGVVSPVVFSLLGPPDSRCRVRLQVSRVARARHTIPKVLQRLVTYTGVPLRTMAPVRLAKFSYFWRVSGSIASRYSAAYHYRFMHTARSHLSKSRCLLLLALPALLAALCSGPEAAIGQESNEILPLSQVRAGMQGYAYTIFAGDQVEKFNLEVIGVLENFLGPKQSIILVQLKGPKVEHTGVVAGMSGSPVYLDRKLAGASSLKT